jgi:predicted SnoaL-like aldol condensation-catalyzing enzyme
MDRRCPAQLGPTAVSDPDKADANKKLAAAFVDDVLVYGRLDRLAVYFDSDHYRQHNPQIAEV